MHDPVEDRRALDFSKELASLGWYHSIEVPNAGVIPGYLKIDELKQRYADFGLPEDLTGKRVLDVGAWDGFFSFELEKHGAEVVAVDVADLETFRTAHRMLKSKVRYVTATVYDLPGLGLGSFDIVLLDSFVVDGEEAKHIHSDTPWMEFYEFDELGGQLDNWFGPSVACLMALTRAAGFVRPRLLNIWHRHARVKAFRNWEPEPAHPEFAAPTLEEALHKRNFGINFDAGADDLISCWFQSPQRELQREDVRLEVGGYAANCLEVRQDEAGGFAACQVPKGLPAGWHDVRLRTTGSRFGAPGRIAIDVPVVCSEIRLLDVSSTLESPFLKFICVVEGLALNADRANTAVYLSQSKLVVERVEWVPERSAHRVIARGVEEKLRPAGSSRSAEISVMHGGRTSAGFPFPA